MSTVYSLCVVHVLCKHCCTGQVKAAKKPGKLSGKQAGKGKKKKTTLRYQIDCTHPVEDGIMDVANFVSPCLVLRQMYC